MTTSILKDLYSGRIPPTDRQYVPNPELDRLHGQREDEMERFLRTLSPEDGERLHRLEGLYLKICDQLEHDAFAYGFCLGTQLLLAALSLNPAGE